MIKASTLKLLYREVGDTVGNDKLRCNELLSEIHDNNRKSRLTDFFHEALHANAAFENIDQPFVNPATIKARKAIGPDTRCDTRICYLLSLGNVAVSNGPINYSFRYVSRELPPQRREAGGVPTSGAGGIDYTGAVQAGAILGEIKCSTDKGNVFSAFIQLLNYLSEMATENQIKRANKHNEFGIPLQFQQPFDLHILIVDPKDQSQKMDLIQPTRQLVEQFKIRLNVEYPLTAAVVGNVLCLRMNSADFAQGTSRTLECVWAV